MRIAHVIDYFHTDVGYQEYYLARAQGLAGHDVRVVASPFRHHLHPTVGPDQQQMYQDLRNAKVVVTRTPAVQMGHDRAWLRHLWQLLDTFGPDVIHCHGPFSPTTVRCASYGRRRKVGVLVDNHMGEHNSPAATSLVARSVYRGYAAIFGTRLRNAIGAWVAVGPEEAEFLSRRLDIPLSAIRLIPLGFENEAFAYNSERRHRLRAERGWGTESVIAVTGNLHASKRVDIVAGACERAASHMDIRLVLAGTIAPQLLQIVKEQAERLLRVGRLTVLPMLPRSELADLYLASDIVVFPTPSISVFEAAGTGAVVLLGRSPYAEWITTLSEQFAVFDPHGVHPFPIASGEDREAAAQEIQQLFAWPVISHRFIKEYERLA